MKLNRDFGRINEFLKEVPERINISADRKYLRLTKSQLKGPPIMKERSHAIPGIALLLALTCALALGMAAAHAQNQNPAQTPRASASPPAPSPTPTPINWSDDPMLKRFVFRGIGPASMGGRIDDIAAVDSNPYTIYVGFATNGVWKSTNNGTTWQPIFDIY